MPVQVNEDVCSACGDCADVCPSEAIKVEETAVVNQEECIDCGACVDACPNEALTLE